METDPDQLVQVVLNMALNGRDAMPDGGCLTITTSDVERDGEPFVCVEVTDTGTGMDEDVRSRVFEPFFTTKDTGKGTGLGLATAYGFVSQSGGRIEIESALDQGSTFRVLLPAPLPRARSRLPAPCMPANRGTAVSTLSRAQNAMSSSSPGGPYVLAFSPSSALG